MKLINPYPNFTIEQIKFLSNNIKFYITNHGHSTDIDYFGMDINQLYKKNSNKIDDKTTRAISDILSHIYFLNLQLIQFEDAYKRYHSFDDSKFELMHEESKKYLSNLRNKILEVMNKMTESNKRIWPIDILEELKISKKDSHYYEDYCMSLYGYINGFAIANGKTIDSNISIDNYIDTEKDPKSIIKALDFICTNSKPHLSEMSNTNNIFEHNKKLLLSNNIHN